MATASATNGNNSFFSSFSANLNTFANNLGSAAESILPVWSGVTAIKQQHNQLSNPTVDQSKLPPNQNGIGGFIKSNPVTVAAIAAVLVIGAVLLFRR